MNVMALDLELNQPSRSIIQIGIVIGNSETGAILEKKEWIIYVNEEINPYITTLTTITQEMVDQGVYILQAYNELVELYKKHNCALNMITWGGGDHSALKEGLEQYCTNNKIDTPRWEFGYREFDVKTLFQAFSLVVNKKVQSGLAKSMVRVGLNFKGTKHWAPDDAENTFQLMMKLLRNIPKNVIVK